MPVGASRGVKTERNRDASEDGQRAIFPRAARCGRAPSVMPVGASNARSVIDLSRGQRSRVGHGAGTLRGFESFSQLGCPCVETRLKASSNREPIEEELSAVRPWSDRGVEIAELDRGVDARKESREPRDAHSRSEAALEAGDRRLRETATTRERSLCESALRANVAENGAELLEGDGSLAIDRADDVRDGVMRTRRDH
jgi:hypothetical protein